MSLHRRPVGRGRRLAIIAALVVLLGCLLPWFTFVGDGVPDVLYRAFDGSGILAFVAALATVALVVLPYAMGERPIGADRWIAYALLAAVAVIGIGIWPVQFLDEPTGLLPDRAPGFWIALVGALALARAAFDVAREPRLH
jgi:multidrug transporter EmrE-like cation transporter